MGYGICRFYGASGNACNVGALEPQTWTELQTKGGMRTMSVTDKMMRWAALGVQGEGGPVMDHLWTIFAGALLTHFIGPVPISTLTLGTDADVDMLQHAIGNRLAGAAPEVTLRAPYIQLPT